MAQRSVAEAKDPGSRHAPYCGAAARRERAAPPRRARLGTQLMGCGMTISGPDGVDAAIAAGLDLDGSPIPPAMLALYREVMELEAGRARSGVKKSMRNRIVRTGAKHMDRESLDRRLREAGWEGLKDKEIAFFYGS